MKLKSRNRTILLPVICFLLLAAAVHGQTIDDKWKNVQALSEKRSVVVETKAGKTIKAKFQSTTDDVLRLLKDGRTVEFNRTDVAAVYLGRRGSIAKRAIIGALAGAGAGALVGVAYTIATKTNGLAAAAGFLYGIPAGAIIGGVSGGRTKKGTLIYESR
jgi:hypothetical protein